MSHEQILLMPAATESTVGTGSAAEPHALPGHLADAAHHYLDLAGNLFVVLDATGRVTLVNRCVCEFLGLEESSIIGRSWFDDIVGEEHGAPQARAAFQQAVATGGFTWKYFEFRLRRNDGEVRLLAWRNSLLREDDQIVGSLCVGEDITDRRRMERALYESEQRLRCLVTNNPDAILISDGFLIHYANPAGVSLFGATNADQLSGLDGRNNVHPDDRETVATALEGLTHGEQTWHGEFRIVGLDGVTRVVDAYITASPHEGGNLLQTVARDVSRQRQIERELRRRGEEHRQAVLRSPLPMMVHADDGEIQVLSSAWTEVTGYSRDEIRTMEDWLTLAFGSRRSQLRQAFDQLSNSDAPRATGEFPVRTRDGHERLWEFYSSPLGADANGRRYIVTIAVDVTDRFRLQREIVDVSERERNRIGNDLHDGLASHLSGIAMLARALANDLREGRPVDSRELDEIAELARAGTEQARALARGLSPIAGRLGSLEEGLRVLASDAHIISGMDCRVDCDDDLPQIAPDAAVQLYWIAREALSNAVRHSRATRITISLTADESSIQLTIADNGTGRPEHLDAGDGLGLNIMGYRASILGARLMIAAGRGGGLEVRVVAPRYRVDHFA
jgi:PAS domain S-box-containing protein